MTRIPACTPSDVAFNSQTGWVFPCAVPRAPVIAYRFVERRMPEGSEAGIEVACRHLPSGLMRMLTVNSGQPAHTEIDRAEREMKRGPSTKPRIDDGHTAEHAVDC